MKGKFSSRDAFFLLLALLAISAAIYFAVQYDAQQPAVYSEVRTLFEQEQVKSFSFSGKTLTLNLREVYTNRDVLTYEIYDFSLFYADFNDLVVEQYRRGILEQYNYPKPEKVSNVWLMLPALLLVILLVMLIVSMRRVSAMQQAAMHMDEDGAAPQKGTKSRAKDGSQTGKKVVFDDVAGADEEKEELQEIVSFLKNPEQFTALGARIPKGVLLVGPPGTGKTLLARAVAGEADVRFLTISGSDFVELYVGVGAGRVRDLFQEAKEIAPCIVFIDEIDAVGRRRGAGLGGGHDEREQTLNQLLVEMDGFSSNEGVIVLAATNRRDILDPALLRAGRFDRHVYVGYPDVKGREEILKIHTRNKPLADDVNLHTIASMTIGFTGADLENLMNEAALLAARHERKFITAEDLDEAMLKVVAGPEKKSRVMTEKERVLTAYHEAGHAVASWGLALHDPVQHITIIPRGGAGGMTIYRPEEELRYETRESLKQRLISVMGGRVAEALVLGDISNGASSDLRSASNIARAMVAQYGMSEKVGTMVFDDSGNEVFIGRSMAQQRSYSEEMAGVIDQEIKAILDEAYQTCEASLVARRAQLETVAQYLLEHETMDADAFVEVMKGVA